MCSYPYLSEVCFRCAKTSIFSSSIDDTLHAKSCASKSPRVQNAHSCGMLVIHSDFHIPYCHSFGSAYLTASHRASHLASNCPTLNTMEHSQASWQRRCAGYAQVTLVVESRPVGCVWLFGFFWCVFVLFSTI